MAIRIHKEIDVNGAWHHWEGRTIKDIDASLFFSVLDRYCLGMTVEEDDHLYSGLTEMDYLFGKDSIPLVIYLKADDISRLRKIWNKEYGDFDKQIGYFLWDSGDVIGFPEEKKENARRGFKNYRMFVWAA